MSPIFLLTQLRYLRENNVEKLKAVRYLKFARMLEENQVSNHLLPTIYRTSEYGSQRFLVLWTESVF